MKSIGARPAARAIVDDLTLEAGRGRVPRSRWGNRVNSVTRTMAGASLTLVKLDDELNRLFDAPAEVAVRIF